SLARTRGHVELIQALIRLTVSHFADVGIGWFKSNEGDEWGPVSAEGAEGQPPVVPADMQALEQAVRRVQETGQPLFIDDIPELKPLQIPRQTLSSAYVLPLLIQGKARGVLAMARRRGSPTRSIADMPLAAELCYRAALALENVVLLEKIREADRRKDEFLGMLAHELRNPLGPIFNAVRLQKMLPQADGRHSDLREIIERQAKHMGRLIDDLLDATRLAHGKILLRQEPCDLADVVRQTVEDYRSTIEASGLKLDIYCPAKAVWIEGDRTRLVQAIGNLLHNAAKFTNSGGVITVRLELDHQAKLVVSDTGIGIEPAMIGQIFDVFRQAEQGLDRSRGGLGLGLALVKGLVELHGGTVQALSQGTDKGTQFVISLPMNKHDGEKAATPARGDVRMSGKRSILVIEDNPDAAESMGLLLRLEGHEVKTAATGPVGLEVARNFRPQIIVCDIGLPGMDGYQVVRTIREDEMLSSAFIIALTGYGREQDKRHALEAGFDLHLTKPVDFNSLRNACASAQEKRRA
nr:ATP-binding protein [Pseudomonadota bacterium]